MQMSQFEVSCWAYYFQGVSEDQKKANDKAEQQSRMRRR